ncbi:MAG TPA: T9SS type A sorting domain-containing protein, partial [Bacteroidia bacterium]|nr:T9SS type A sorting domain-containing protein [Bacteroidia bacterium]
LTDVEGPAVDYTNIAYTDNNDMVFVPNDTMRITGTFINYLGTINNLNTTLTVISGGSYVTILDGSHSVGTLGTMGTATQASDPYQIKINTNCPYNQTIVFKLNMTDGVYSVNKYFSQIVNGDYINITINDIWTTIPSQGRIGFRNSQQSQGLGFCYQGSGTLLYDASLMVGTSSAKVSDMIRGATAGQDDNDFQSQQIVQAITPPVVSDFDAMGVFRDNISPAPLPVTVRHREFAWATAPHRKYIIVQYSIMNTGATTLSNMYAGIFADWDIDASTSGQNRADVDNTNRMGYVYSTVAGGKYCGIKLLTNGAFNNYAIDNISGGGGGVNIYDNFTTAEKYQTLSTSRAQAGTTGQGNDVCHVVSSGPFTVAAGDSIVVAFALIAGDDLSDLQNSAVDAQSMYNNLPLGSPVTVAHITTGLNAFPNPASGMTQISYNVAEGGNTDIRLVDAQGRLVRMLDTGDKSPGAYSVMLDAAELSDGIYFVQMISNGKLTTQKFVVSH